MAPQPLHYTAFATSPAGGNLAGVVLDAGGMSDAEMLALAARLGYSESAFLTPRPEPGHHDVRYFSPEAEVDGPERPGVRVSGGAVAIERKG